MKDKYHKGETKSHKQFSKQPKADVPPFHGDTKPVQNVKREDLKKSK